jgi:hypothetical protein
METKLILADGTELERSEALESDGKLFIYVQNGYGLREVFDLLIDPEKTKKITQKRLDTSIIIRGYKKLTAVRDEGNGLITAVIAK